MIQGIKNLIRWFRIIWKDRDWDYSFMEEMLLIKMKRMKNLSKKDFFKVEGDKDIKSLAICIKILERRKKDWYSKVHYYNIGHKEEIVFKSVENDLYELDLTGINNHEREFSLELWKTLKKVEDRDWRIFCRILEKYENIWWC